MITIKDNTVEQRPGVTLVCDILGPVLEHPLSASFHLHRDLRAATRGIELGNLPLDDLARADQHGIVVHYLGASNRLAHIQGHLRGSARVVVAVRPDVE